MWIPVTASAQGLAYSHEGRNNQDAYASWTDGNVAIVFINDGCHASKFSEVGARLSSGFLVRKTREMILQGTPLAKLGTRLFSDYLDFLEWQVESQFFDFPQEINEFIGSHLYCTALGIVATPKQVMFLSCGDGSFYLNDHICETIRSPQNKPTYPAYNLFPRFGIDVGDDLKELIPDSFRSTVYSSSEVQLAGMASDGLSDLPLLVEELKEHSQSSLSLQLCLNRIAVIRAETRDNVTISFVHKKEV